MGLDNNGGSRTAAHAGTTTIAMLCIQLRYSDTTGNQSQTNSADFAFLGAAIADHAFESQTAVADHGAQCPGCLVGIILQRTGWTVLGTGPTKCALALLKIHDWQAVWIGLQDVVGTGGNALAASIACSDELLLITMPGRPQ